MDFFHTLRRIKKGLDKMYSEKKYAEYVYICELISKMEAYVINKQMSSKFKDKIRAKTMRKALKWARECVENLNTDIENSLKTSTTPVVDEKKNVNMENVFCTMYNPVHPTGSWCTGMDMLNIAFKQCFECAIWIGNRKELEGYR